MQKIYLSLAISVIINNAYAYDSKDDADLFKERSSVDYTQKGIRAGNFTVLPKYDTSEEYISNVFYPE